MPNYALVAQHLRNLGEGTVQPSIKRLGVCSELKIKFNIKDDFLVEMFSEWPEHDGAEPEFPVAERSEFMRDNLWNDSEYGRKRRRLCLWLADKFDEYANVD